MGKNLENNSKKKDIDSKAESPEIFPEDFDELIKFIPDKNKKDAIKILSSLSIKTATSFRGPLPPPSILKDYNEIIDNGAERIMKMVEKQSGHRIELEKQVIGEELKQSRYRQMYGFIIAIIGIGTAIGLALSGHDTIAGVFGTTTIIGFVTIFVVGKKRQSKEIED